MSKTYNRLKIEIKNEITDIITAKQDDTKSRYLDVYLYDDGVPMDLTGNEVRIYMRKPDGTEIFNNGTITDSKKGRCQFELTSQALGAVGVLFAEISIWKNNTEILTSQTFHIFVAETLRSTGSIESSNEYGALVVLFQNLYESLDLMKDMIDNYGAAGAIAKKYGVDTFWEISEMILEALKTSSTAAIVELIGQPTDNASKQTLFGKIYGMNTSLTNVIQKSNEIVFFSDTVLETPLNQTITLNYNTSDEYLVVSHWTPQRTGFYKIKVSMSNSAEYVTSFHAISSPAWIGIIGGGSLFNDFKEYDNMRKTAVGSTVSRIFMDPMMPSVDHRGTSTGTVTLFIYAKKNIPVVFLGRNSSSNNIGYIHKIQCCGTVITTA